MMDDLTIQFGEGRLGVNMTKATLNEHLRQHGLCVMPLPAPAPPPQTEAERFVVLADRLPAEVWEGSGYAHPSVRASWCALHDTECGENYECCAVQFRTILLGVMAAYVGTESNAVVKQWRDGSYGWGTVWQSGKSRDLLTAYRDCCLAIARKRGGA